MMNGKHVVAKVVRNKFLVDPRLGHHCIPYKTTKDRLQRAMMKKYQEVRKDPSYANQVTEEVWEGVLEFLAYYPSNGTKDERLEMAELFHDREYESTRRHISRLINTHKQHDITLDNVPESLAVLPDVPAASNTNVPNVLFEGHNQESSR
ncbi:hypothetical protein ANCCAN_16356 [Ancylostoma caninum]|uniref:Uncharacterized protein n=1 Tax=Ancylostoma caninum TaxID=29170 RepID=A0A368G526_ANCCA|nr:hypothetical protein ANCCAN_16356 [Ancylostoma caninum]